MNWLRGIVAGLLALFIDDGRFAIAILVWLALLAVLLPNVSLPAAWRAPLLAVGLLAILVEGVMRRAGQ